MDVILVHGYNVTSTQTYGVLPQRLKKAGHNVRNVYLSKYVTLDNELTMDDLVRAFQSALSDLYGPSLGKSEFACVTHSTGGLLARAWVTSQFGENMSRCPLSHLIMLAPPNFGSRLASLGMSRLSRLRSLWGVEPGLQILKALDIASQMQWDLNNRWLDQGTANAPGFYPFVIAGQWIDKTVWDAIVPATYERGSDGVVRACAANLNFRKISIDGQGNATTSSLEGIPFLVAPKSSHSDENGIMMSIPSFGDHPVLTAILAALDVGDRKSYQSLATEFAKQTEDLQKTEPYYDGTTLDRYSQMVIRVVDQNGKPISEHAIELIDRNQRGDRFPTGFLEHSYQNQANPEMFSYYLDYDVTAQVVGGEMGLRVHSVSGSPLVAYKDQVFIGPSARYDQLIAPNQTTYIEFVLNRHLNKNIFRLTSDFSYQKIERKAGPDWIN